jgi:hypothetical protein
MDGAILNGTTSDRPGAVRPACRYRWASHAGQDSGRAGAAVPIEWRCLIILPMEQQIIEITASRSQLDGVNDSWIAALEAGKVLYFPNIGFTPAEAERRLF